MCKENSTNENVRYDERSNDQYSEFLELIKNRFSSIVVNGTPLFMTNAENLFEVFLQNLPDNARQHYACNACRHFVNHFGGLVTISEDGKIKSILWNENEVPDFFVPSVKAMKKIILQSKVKGVFLSEVHVLGQPVTGEWHHMSATLPAEMVYRSRIMTAGQAMAEKLEEFKMLVNGLLAYSLNVVEQAETLLKSETLYRSDKCLGVAEWLKKLHFKRENANASKDRDNITWLAVATAPCGFCHVKSTMIGTLLDDIVAGLSSDVISRNFAEKMNPANYMRSQTAPTQSGIQQAEKLVEKLGIAKSLKRRYATFEEIPVFLWENNYSGSDKKNVKVAGGVFGNIVPKGSTITEDKISLPSTVMTWDKFQKTILPAAENIEALIDNPSRLMALVTASDPAAENILQWDNLFSWYYHGGIDGEIKRRVESAGGKYENNEIRCSLIWEGYTDLDLHCITPSNEHVYFGHKSVGQGWLDIDANGGCATTMAPVENIRWSDRALTGRYKFYVHNYCERGNGKTPFKVELDVSGKIYTYNGVASSTGYQTDVFNFIYEKGKQPNIYGTNCTSDDSWNVPVNSFVKVNGITNSPNLWGAEPVTHSGTHVFFILDKCKDLSEGKGRGFFNEILKPELREIRKTLEAYTANTPIEGSSDATACGVGYNKDNEWNLTLKVTSNNSSRLIKIDRWD